MSENNRHNINQCACLEAKSRQLHAFLLVGVYQDKSQYWEGHVFEVLSKIKAVTNTLMLLK